MRLAVIDCGTNTFNLIIIQLSDSSHYKRLHNSRVAVKLGEGTINERFIAKVPFERALNAIDDFNKTIRKYQVEKTLAFATSAIRDASNGRDFTEQVKVKYSIDITTIDGNKEAELIYYGVREAVRLKHSVSLIMDIGGGSNEFILANNNGILWKQSFPIGAARVLEKFCPSNPIQEDEIGAINNYLKTELKPLSQAYQKFPAHELVGSSGAFDSLVEMIEGELGGENFSLEKTEYKVVLEDYRKISDLVIKSNLEERKKIKGLVPMRFDMIVISCIMINFVLEELGLKQMRVSTYSLKEGAIANFINQY